MLLHFLKPQSDSYKLHMDINSTRDPSKKSTRQLEITHLGWVVRHVNNVNNIYIYITMVYGTYTELVNRLMELNQHT